MSIIDLATSWGADPAVLRFSPGPPVEGVGTTARCVLSYSTAPDVGFDTKLCAAQ